MTQKSANSTSKASPIFDNGLNDEPGKVLNYELVTNMRMVLLCGVIAMLVSLSRAVEIGGQWRAEFDTQIGLQKYVFTFQTDGSKVTKKASTWPLTRS